MIHELSGKTSQPVTISEPEYQPITIDRPLDLPIISDVNLPHFPAFSPHVSQLESSNTPCPSKRKADAASNDQQPRKASKRTCQKCGDQDHPGSSSRKYCKGVCQDCGKVECCGRNSQHPKKKCAVGWDFHHKKLK